MIMSRNCVNLINRSRQLNYLKNSGDFSILLHYYLSTTSMFNVHMSCVVLSRSFLSFPMNTLCSFPRRRSLCSFSLNIRLLRLFNIKKKLL